MALEVYAVGRPVEGEFIDGCEAWLDEVTQGTPFNRRTTPGFSFAASTELKAAGKWNDLRQSWSVANNFVTATIAELVDENKLPSSVNKPAPVDLSLIKF